MEHRSKKIALYISCGCGRPLRATQTSVQKMYQNDLLCGLLPPSFLLPFIQTEHGKKESPTNIASVRFVVGCPSGARAGVKNSEKKRNP